jgi:hypothetical protein
MCSPFTTRVTVKVVPFEMCRFGFCEWATGAGLPVGEVELADGNGAAHPTSRAQSRPTTPIFNVR